MRRDVRRVIWTQKDKYYLQCGPYKVTKVYIANEAFYEAWYLTENLKFRLPTAEEAKRVCEDDRRSKLSPSHAESAG